MSTSTHQSSINPEGGNSSSDMNNPHAGRQSETIIQNPRNVALEEMDSKEEITSSPPFENAGDKKRQDLTMPAIEESTQARLERLGRQRPEAFPSIWSEIGFVFSISMCQVLSVSLILDFFVLFRNSSRLHYLADHGIGILCIRIHSSSPYGGYRSECSTSFCDMAS